MKTISIVLCVVLVLLTGCAATTIVTGSGRLTTENRSVSNFNAVAFTSAGDLTIVQGDTEALSVEAEDNLLPYIKTEVKAGTLTITGDKNNGRIVYNPTKTIRYQLSVKNLSSVDFAGAGNIRSASLQSDQFHLVLSGAGTVVIDHLEAKNVTSTLSGVGGLTLSGQVTSQSAKLSGLGGYQAANLSSQSASVDISGAGSATVWARDSLDVTTSGAGKVYYYGSPRVQQSKSGAGTVTSLGNK